MTSKLTRERLEKIKSWRETYGAGSNVMLPAEEAEELARIALAAMDREHVRNEHAEWSQATFGNVGPVGPLKHLSKEALEAAEQPGDLSEWADMQFLLWDAQRRAGITDEQITQAMIEKLAVNKQREWPEPKDGEPRLHIKEQPAPVVPDERDKAVDADDHPLLWSFNEGWNACRSAMLAAAPQSPGSEPATVPGKWIPVSERMPEDRTQVILWDSEIGEVTSGHYSHKTQTFYHCGDAIENEITHWMPPPCAPQEVK
ncbi:dATP/dGTP pyrophosphohydrolase domain-containing protein [Klebsiella pneumoniae]|uniref:dATP/dGTP pyrophosphohydrolase domain-containing protein n=1 Tax=Klebsiella pneumoniae TaxID=573 RepID=UPI001034D929|nr:dATP/dGTP pyrophosphohydrolase domain-containing protein [Klebsiella pneumoniae]